jgi:hypothetical protein
VSRRERLTLSGKDHNKKNNMKAKQELKLHWHWNGSHAEAWPFVNNSCPAVLSSGEKLYKVIVEGNDPIHDVDLELLIEENAAPVDSNGEWRLSSYEEKCLDHPLYEQACEQGGGWVRFKITATVNDERVEIYTEKYIY